MTDGYTLTIRALLSALTLADGGLERRVLSLLPALVEARARHWTKGAHGYFTGSYSDGAGGGSGGKGLDKSAGSGIILAKEEMPRKVKGIAFSVDWNEVSSSTYSDKFKQLSENPTVSAAIETRAKWALNNRDGAETEEIYAVSLSTGREIARITDQNIVRGVKRTKTFSERVKEADGSGDRILFIHNHPSNTPPSPTDFNELLNTRNASGIVVGHGGSIYFYTRPLKAVSEIDYRIKLRHFKEYAGNDILQAEKALESLQDDFGFTFKKL